MKFKFFVAATLALLPTAVSAQTVSQSPGTTYYTNGPISGGVSANQLFGVTLTAYWGATSSTYAFASLGSGIFGWSDANLTVSGLGVTPTYTLGWLLDNLPAVRWLGERCLQINGLYRHGFLIAPAMLDAVLELMQVGHSGHSALATHFDLRIDRPAVA